MRTRVIRITSHHHEPSDAPATSLSPIVTLNSEFI